MLTTTNCLTGPSVFEVFSALLRHLRISVERQIRAAAVEPGEQAYQEALVVTIGEFATNLPDYQKIEIMRFIMDKVVVKGSERERGGTGEDHVSATWLPLLLLRSLLKVATKYVPVQMTTTFPLAFLDLLMKVSLSGSAELRILIQVGSVSFFLYVHACLKVFPVSDRFLVQKRAAATFSELRVDKRSVQKTLKPLNTLE